MPKTATILQAGKQIAAIAGGRAFKGEELKTHPEDILDDPAAEKLGNPASGQRAQAEKESMQDPGQSE